MNKFKKILLGTLSVLTLGLFVATGARVDAADSITFYDASIESETDGKEYASNSTIKSDDYLKLETIAAKSNVKAHVDDADGKVWTISGKGLLYTNSTSSSKNLKFTNLSKSNTITVTVSISACDSKGNLKAAAVTFGTNTSVTTSTTEKVNASIEIGTESSVVLWTGSSTRTVLYTVAYTVNAESENYKASFSLGSGVTGNNPTAIEVDKNGNESERTITLPTTSATKTAFKFVGWNNGDSSDSNNPYKANTSYVLTKDVTFTAVWEADVLDLPTNYSYTFDSVASTSYLAIEGGQIHSNGIKTTNDLVITFKLANPNTITLTFDDYNLGSSNKIKIDDDSYAVTTTTLEVELGAGLHTIKRDNKEFRLASISTAPSYADSVTTALYKQFDKNTNPTMLRLMGKIEGIAYADYENISNVLMEFDFNNGTTTTSKSAYCYKLYKSIKTLDGSLDADEDGKTMYVVLTISGLEKYSSMSFTNVKMTITFSDGSTKEATHTNF